MKIIQNTTQLRAWLARDPHTIGFCKQEKFRFEDDVFNKAMLNMSSHHLGMATEQLEMRVTRLLLHDGHECTSVLNNVIAANNSPRWHRVLSVLQKKETLQIIWAISILFLLLVMAVRGHAQNGNRTSGIVIQMKNQGTNLGAPIGGGLITLNASTNVTLARTGTTSLFTITATGGAGSGCTPPGTTLNAILTDLTGGACGAATKWTASTTTLTGIATAILDMSAAARLRLPQVSAPTIDGDAAFNTTTHLPVWGFNGASTATIPLTLANSAHKWFNSYDQTTGLLTATQPDYSDLSGVPSTFAPAGHNLLSSAHSDTTAAAAVRGDGLFAIGVTPTWQRLAHPGTTGGYFKWNGTDIVASTGAASGTGSPTTCTGQFVTVFTLSSDAAPTSTCVSLSAVNSQNTTYQVLAADFDGYKTIAVPSGTFTITLVASGTQPAAGKYIQVINYGSGVITIARSGQNINGAAGNFTLNAGSATAPTSTYIQSDGTNYIAAIDEGTLGTITSVATTSPITGGTVTSGAVTVACGTCATTTNGGSLSGTSPVTVSAAGAIGCATCGVKLCSGTQALGTSAISSGANSVLITISCTGISTSMMDFASDPHAVTGYAPSASGTLTVVKYISTNNLNIYVYNDTGSSITPGAMSVNYAGY